MTHARHLASMGIYQFIWTSRYFKPHNTMDQTSKLTKHLETPRFNRMKANCSMSFKRVACGTQTHALCLDISASGLVFETSEAVEVGRALEIRTFPADRVTPPITALIEVIRCAKTDDGHFRIVGVIKGIKSQAPESTTA